MRFRVFFIFLGLFFYNGFPVFSQKNPEQTFAELDSIGRKFWRNASYTSALACYQKALIIAKNLKDLRKEAKALSFLGVIYENQGNFDTSFKYHFQAIRIREQINDTLLAHSYMNIGIVYGASGNIDKSLEYYSKAIEANKKNKDKKIDAHNNYHIASALKTKKEYEKATKYAEKSLQIALKWGIKDIQSDTQHVLGLIATEQKQYEKGREYYQKAFELATKEKDWLILSYNLQHFAENYMQNGQYQKALEFAKKSLDLAKKHGLKAEEQLAYKIIAEIYANTNDYANAYVHHLQYQNLKDTLFNLKKNQQIQELTLQYETEKKEQKIELLEKDKKINQDIILLLILGIALAMLLSMFLYFYDKTRRMLQKQQLEITKAKNLSLAMELEFKEKQNQVEKEIFEEKMAQKERELTSTTLHIFQKNELLSNMQEKLDKLDVDVRTQIKPMFEEIRNNINLEKDWANFELHFLKVHPNFFINIRTKFSNLSQNELKLLAYLRLKLANKEIANMLNITPKSVEMSRYRLKKKFNLSIEESLDELIEQF